MNTAHFLLKDITEIEIGIHKLTNTRVNKNSGTYKLVWRMLNPMNTAHFLLRDITVIQTGVHKLINTRVKGFGQIKTVVYLTSLASVEF